MFQKLAARARKLKTDVPALFLCMKDRETPVIAKILAGLTIAYALSPIDLIPDFIPVLGYLDDIILLPAMVALTIRLIPPAVFARCRIEAEGLWANGKPGKWYFAIPIALFWCVILFLILRKFLHGFN